jgi:hypothetical protein
MKGYRKILIAINASKEVLVQGLKLACDEKSWVIVVKVIPPYEGDLNLTGIKDIKSVLNGEKEKLLSKIEDIAKKERALIKTRNRKGRNP